MTSGNQPPPTRCALVVVAATRASEDGSPVLAEGRPGCRSLWMQGHAEEVEAAFRSRLEFRERVLGPESGLAAESRAGLGLALILRGDEVEGPALLRGAVDAYRSYGLMVPAFLEQIEATLGNLAP